MKFQITNSEPIQFFNTNGELVGTILIDANGDMTLRPESGSSRDIILGDPNVAGDVQMGLASAPINLELLGGGTITSNGNTLNIGSIANGDTVIINTTSLSGSFSGSFEGSITSTSVTFSNLPTSEPTVTGSAWISGSSVAHPNSGYLMIFNP
jgi:hypothetical protein